MHEEGVTFTRGVGSTEPREARCTTQRQTYPPSGGTMPEGDAVWRTARRLRDALRGRPLVASDFRVPAYATLDLSGRTVDDVVSHGKHLLMHLGDSTVHSHLGMDGAWHTYPAGARWRRPGHQARMVLSTGAGQAVGFALRTLEVVPQGREHELVAHLGPDLLGADWDAVRAVANLRDDPARPVGLALLDQRNLAGVGNIYRSEVCFVRGVDPRAPVDSVRDLDRLVDTAHRMLHANLEQDAIVTTGNRRRGEQTWVYGRSGLPCRRCGTTVVRDYLGDAAAAGRSVYLCPSCQPPA